MGKTDIYAGITFITAIIYMFLFSLLYGQKQVNEFKNFLEENGLDREKYKFNPRLLLGFISIKERKIRQRYRRMVFKGWLYFAAGIIFIFSSGLFMSYLARTLMKP